MVKNVELLSLGDQLVAQFELVTEFSVNAKVECLYVDAAIVDYTIQIDNLHHIAEEKRHEIRHLIMELALLEAEKIFKHPELVK